jgi:predicted nucleotidyltransferase
MDIEERARGVLEASRGVVCAYLYGSRARGSARPDSDVDIAVLFETDPPATFEGLPLDLEGDLENAIGLPVQLLVLNGAPADLVHRVLRDGVLLLERDPSARIRFEVRRRNEYFDLLPVLREYRRHAPGEGDR